MSDDEDGFGGLLRAWRASARLTQQELAELSGMSVRTISGLERGQTLRPHRNSASRLADALGLDKDQRAELMATAGRRPRPARTAQQRGPGPEPGSGGGADPAEVPRQLPAAVRGFAGRRAELAVLSAMLDEGPDAGPSAMVISAVSGTAGVGKTALAVQWAHQIADRYPDGQLYVNLRGYDPAEPVAASDALATLLRALGVSGAAIPDEVEDRSLLFRSKLAGRRMLVLLDNARHADQVRPLLPGDPGCVAIVTSRDSLAGLVAAQGARRLSLDVLPLADAVTLLRSLIGSRAEDDPQAAEALAGLCARLPLALRIAAELATAHEAVPLSDLVAQLAQARLDYLDAEEDRVSVRAVLSWSYRDLAADVAELFALTGLHPGADLDVYAAAALGGIGLAPARRALSHLHRASLIQAAAPGRYSMHDLLRAYARELATGSCALTRLFDYYLAASATAMDVLYPAEAHRRPRVAAGDAVVPAMPDQDDARAWLDRERANLVAVVVDCARDDRSRYAADLSATLYRYLLTGSHLPEADTIYRHALHAARRSGDVAAEAGALNSLGSIAIIKGHLRDAIACFEPALAAYLRCGDQASQGRVLYNLGLTLYKLNDDQAAVSRFRQALTSFESAQDYHGVAATLSSLAAAELRLGLLDQAADHLQHALKVFRGHDDPVNEADTLSRIGELGRLQGSLTEAAVYHQQALDIYRRIDHPSGVGYELGNLGEVSLDRGDWQRAIGYLREALALFGRNSHKHGQILALRNLARAFDAAGQPAAARAELETALLLAAETGHTYEQARAHDDLAESYHRDGQDQQSRHHWQQALTLYTDIGAAEAARVQSRLGYHQ